METTTENGVAVQDSNKVAKGLTISLPATVKTVEVNDVVCEDAEDQKEAIKQHIRCAILKQFGVREVQKTAVSAGKLFMNGNRTALTLPKVKTATNGSFAETYTDYALRVLPAVKVWFLQAVQNSAITLDEVTALI